MTELIAFFITVFAAIWVAFAVSIWTGGDAQFENHDEKIRVRTISLTLPFFIVFVVIRFMWVIGRNIATFPFKIRRGSPSVKHVVSTYKYVWNEIDF